MVNTKDTQNVNRASAIRRKIQRILCKNNPNGGADPDAMENDDKKVFAIPKRSVNPKDVAKEMVNLLELFTQMRGVVERIDDVDIRNKFDETISKLDRVRKDIRDENQDIINDQVPAGNRPPIAQGTFLEFEGGGDNVFKDWT